MLIKPCSSLPLLENASCHRIRHPTNYLRALDSLRSCLDAIFENKMIEARKYIPSVTQTLKSGILSEVMASLHCCINVSLCAMLHSIKLPCVLSLNWNKTCTVVCHGPSYVFISSWDVLSILSKITDSTSFLPSDKENFLVESKWCSYWVAT